MRKILLLTLTTVCLASCVSSKMFGEIEGNYAQLKIDYAALEKEKYRSYDTFRFATISLW